MSFIERENENEHSINVEWKDQEMINRFARLSSRAIELDEELREKTSEREALEDAANELELLMDEDGPVPLKLGDCFVQLDRQAAEDRLSALKEDKDGDVARLQTQLGIIQDNMTDLKARLYTKFGKSINLEK